MSRSGPRTPAAIIQALLQNRHLDQAPEFSLPLDFDRLTYPPEQLSGMEAAVSRLIQARDRQEKIVIFGDYDADGIPATALAMRGLKQLGFTNLHPLIPNRGDGYGLTEPAVQKILAMQPDLILTLDNGSVAVAEVAQLSQKADLIVIDHHQIPDGGQAQPLALVNPNQPDCQYPFKELCACALTWKLILALAKALGQDDQQLKWLLDLVALSTIADMVPLVGENRVLASFGLQVMRKSRNLGLQALAAVAKTDLTIISAGEVAFRLAPRLNAPSRMNQDDLSGQNAALQLLITEQPKEAEQLAQFLNQQNQERQALLEAHILVAKKLSEQQGDRPVLVLFDQDWSSGLIGLVASRMLELFERPVVALAREGLELKGSVRSVDGIGALELLDPAADLLERYGGHAKAAGLTVKPGVEIEQLQEKLWQAPHWQDRSIKPSPVLADLDLELGEASLELAELLEQLAPFGLGFPTPHFAINGQIEAVRAVGKENQHLSFFMRSDEAKRKAIAFRHQGYRPTDGETVTILAEVKKELWNGVESPQLIVKRIDVKK